MRVFLMVNTVHCILDDVQMDMLYITLLFREAVLSLLQLLPILDIRIILTVFL